MWNKRVGWKILTKLISSPNEDGVEEVEINIQVRINRQAGKK